MKFFEQIAQTVVEQASSILGLSMSITDAKGTIIGCSHSERIGSHHPVTKEVTKAKRTVIFTEERVANRENVLPGVATPIFFRQRIIGVLGIIGNPYEVKKFVHFLKSHVELMLEETFRTESFYLLMKATEIFVQHVIHFKEWESEEILANYSEMLGFHFDISRCAIIIDLTPLSNSPLRKKKQSFIIPSYDLSQMIQHLFKTSPEDILSPINQQQWLVLKHIKKDDELKQLRQICERAITTLDDFVKDKHTLTQIAIAYGNRYQGFDGARQSYHQAIRSLKIGKEHLKSTNIYPADDINILFHTFIQELDPHIKKSLTEFTDKLSAHPSAASLIDTFILYCEHDLNMSKTARKLYIHRNTLLYRLKQIKEMLGIDIHSFKQCMLLYIALKQMQK